MILKEALNISVVVKSGFSSIFIQVNSTPVQFSTTNDPWKIVMLMSAIVASSNGTIGNSIAQKGVCSGKIKIRLIQDWTC